MYLGIALGLGVILVILLGVLMNSLGRSQQEQSSYATVTGMTSDMIVAGGCFWCVEADMEKVPGVVEAISGYSGGTTDNPTYETYADGGHREVVRVVFDPRQVTYRQLLVYFLKHIDPTDGNGQFVDRGEQYAPAIYVESEQRQQIARSVLDEIRERAGFQEVNVPVLERTPFWPAEDYHQDYYKEHAIKYKYYRYRSGRDDFIEKHWGEEADRIPTPDQDERQASDDITGGAPGPTNGAADGRTYEKPSDEKLRERLSDIQYKVTQQDDTEPAFDNPYWDEKREGIYVDVVSGEPLFSSRNKYKSGTGWPSFTAPLEPDNIVTRPESGWFTTRTEVRSKHADSHLGHVFEDGPRSREELEREHDTLEESDYPADYTGKRYCMNAAALRFIPKSELTEEGYEQYLSLF